MKKTLAAVLISMILLAAPASVLAFWCPPPGEPPVTPCPMLGVSINGKGGVIYNFTELKDGKCTYFTVEVSIWNVTDLYGYEFELAWDYDCVYFDLVEWDFATDANKMFGVGGWVAIAPAPGYDGAMPYKQAISAKGVAAFSGSHRLVQLKFHMKDDVCWPQKPFVEGWFWIQHQKFYDSCAVLIEICTVSNICFRYIPIRPSIFITPDKVFNCRVWTDENCQNPATFTLTVNVANITKMASLYFNLQWNKFRLIGPYPPIWDDFYTRIINYTKVTVNTDVFPTAKFSWSVAPFETGTAMGLYFQLWNKTALTSCELIRGDFWAVKIDFRKHDPWVENRQPEYTKFATCWVAQNASTPIDFTWTCIDVYCPDLRFIENSTVKGSSFLLDPVEGDLNGDGKVSLTDLMIIGFYYSKSVWSGVNGYYDFNNDGVIDIGDVVIVAKEFGKECKL